MQEPIIKTTDDGSHTLYSERFSQHYHNPNGAVAESRHVFFEQSGLIEALQSDRHLNILEIGFGTGLNLLLLMDYVLQFDSKMEITFHSIEAWPISPETAASLNYGKHLQHAQLTDKLLEIFDSLEKGMNTLQLLPNLEVRIFYGLFDDYNPDNLQTDFIFHDAFSPGVNPDLWTGTVFKKLHAWSHHEAILTTYCAASKAKGAMAWAGWKVAKAPGALGKREMTVASPSAGPLEHLKRVNEERLARRYKEGDF